MNPSPSTSGQRPSPSPSRQRASSSFEIEATEYRVGAPAPLPPPSMRMEVHKPSERLVTQFESNFTMKAFEVLEKHGLEFEDINFCVFSRPGQHRAPSLQIISSWLPELASAWKKTVDDVKRHVDSELYKAGFLESSSIVVEIIDCLAVKPKTMGPILNNQPLEVEWPIIREKVFSILESSESTRGAMNTISIFRYGLSDNSCENPITVYVSLDPDTPGSTWPQVVNRIQAYLDSLSHELKVHMEHQTPDFYAFDLLPPDPGAQQMIHGPPWPAYQERANFGAEIGPCLYIVDGDGKKRNTGFGTLGCYVEVKTQTTPAWKRYALTNYHVVRPCFRGFSIHSAKKEGKATLAEAGAPTKGSDCWDADADGFNPNRPRHRHDIESPARRTHNLVVHGLLEDLGDISADFSNRPELLEEYQEELKCRVAFFDDGRNDLGSLWAGSGFARRSVGNQRLDWALILVRDNRQGSNMLPYPAVWTANFAPHHRPSITNVPLRQSGSRSIRDMNSGDLVFKLGAATGWTSGTYNRFKSKCWVKHDKYMGMEPSSEYVFIPHKSPEGTTPCLATHGDSGSVVFDRSGHIIGLLFTGQKPKNSDSPGHALITPIEDVLADIKSLSKGQITDIRISSW